MKRNAANTLSGLVAVSLLLALVGTRSAEAQQSCYSYDLLGRLTGVIDQNNQVAFYDYDSVGNILSIHRRSLGAPTTQRTSA